MIYKKCSKVFFVIRAACISPMGLELEVGGPSVVVVGLQESGILIAETIGREERNDTTSFEIVAPPPQPQRIDKRSRR
jgi:hypothetical protein